ncbi:hypothetical protein I0P70_19895 [Pontibacter sp. FD36]|uniref:hypothetical protein n=1 Tax=Pontibacter sp. FD36 TaxID=2789860 RepID=UPI0018AA8F03|nr:hypothetical protein [Pontibacter sp. FD36]MBF8965523.1 hypothetical protein [Pontibacter sp. FD36]
MVSTNKKIVAYALLGTSAVAYAVLAYATPRSNFTQLLLLYAFVFFSYLYLVRQQNALYLSIAAALFFRLIFLLATPALSDDYFRFVWDGRLLTAGQNPYLYLPRFFVTPEGPQVPGISQEFFRSLNSPDYYSVYPPVSQAVFWLGVKLYPNSVLGSIVVMRVLILLFEAGNILLFWRLLRKMKLPDKQVLLYALNPLVILELTGNLHFEALMIFFLLLALYLLLYLRFAWSAIAFGLAVGTKLLPLMFLPFLFRKLGVGKFILYGAITLLTVVALVAPVLNGEVLYNIFSSVDLYFRKFEFNAGIYYLMRWIGFRFTGYNLIFVLGPLLSLLTLTGILALATVKRPENIRQLIGCMAAALTLYLLLTTTVHPWYLTTLLALTSLSYFRFAVIWSGFVILTYAAYRTSTYQEDLRLVALEYSIVCVWLMIELYRQRQHLQYWIFSRG